MTRIVHRFPAVEVEGAISYKVNYYARQKAAEVPRLGSLESVRIAALYDGWIEKERSYYAAVRAVRLKKGSYILVYGDRDDQTVESGTGPFNTLRQAKEWFMRGGR